MLDIKFVRENPELVKENIKKKFQDSKLLLVDEVIALDAEYRAAITEGDGLRAQRNKLSKSIGALMAQGKKDEAEAVKKQVTEQADRLKELEMREAELQEADACHPQYAGPQCTHRPRRQRECGGTAFW